MKAVIMAGGEGTRLRPVSSNEPKPMVRIIDRPALGHILNLLRENGVTEACLTLRYMPQAIIDYIGGGDFGLKLHTLVEHDKLGTAGGVRACDDFIGGDDFLVMSGDCVCDFDLRSLMIFHKSKNAEATLALYEHPEPLEYGLVVARGDGRISRFIEKPPWEGVVTNRINTGIYILSPTVLKDIPPGKPYDFGKELFPRLLAENRGLYGMAMHGYWCDIGNPTAYRKCCTDMLEGRVRLKVQAPEIRRGVWSLSALPDGVTIRPPVYIGVGVEIRPGAVVGPRAVIGEGSVIAAGASVSDCVVNGTSMLDNSSVDGAVLCRGAVVGRGASVREDAVIGEGSVVGDGATIFETVRIWPGRRIQAGMPVRDSVTHGHLKEGPAFNSRGVISGIFGAELSAADCLSLGRNAAGFRRVGLSFSGGESARTAAEAVGCGVCAAGGELLRFDCGLPSCASFFGMSLSLPLTVCVTQDTDRLDITFFSKDGGPLPHDAERELLSSSGESCRGAGGAGRVRDFHGVFELYAAAARYAVRDEDGGELLVSVTRGGIQNDALKRALELLGCTVASARNGQACFEAGRGGTGLYAEEGSGLRLSPEQTLALCAAIEIERGRRELAVPEDAPDALEDVAERHGAVIIRLGRDGRRAEELYRELPSLRDAVFAGALICARMQKEGITLAELYAQKVPGFSLVTRELNLRRGRGEVMAALSAMAGEMGGELSNGIKLVNAKGAVTISPRRDKSALRIRGEGADEEIAAELCADAVRRAEDADMFGDRKTSK